jgi:hypothetical protein
MKMKSSGKMKKASLVGKTLKTPNFILAKGDPRGFIPPRTQVTVEEETDYKPKRYKDQFGMWQKTEPQQRVRVTYNGHPYWLDADMFDS